MTNKGYIFLFTFLFFLKIFSIYFTNFSLYGDEAQYWLWSKNLDTGYFSKPPLLAWFIRLYSDLFGSDFSKHCLFFYINRYLSAVYSVKFYKKKCVNLLVNVYYNACSKLIFISYINRCFVVVFLDIIFNLFNKN